jgi:hypothetical protein
MLFGGRDENDVALGDTWLWNGDNWTGPLALTPSPLPRFHSAFAYDSNRKRVVLFGGRDQELNHLTDTWEWDGASWVQIATAGDVPAVGTDLTPVTYRTTYDQHRQRVLLNAFVGIDFGGDIEFWAYDGARWAPESDGIGEPPP